MQFARRLLLNVAFAALTLGCEDSAKVSAQHALAHVEELAGYVQKDVQEVRAGLPEGAQKLATLWPAGGPANDAKVARNALQKARDGVQNLRLAKSTFFALTDGDALVLRSDADQDELAGTNLLAAFPALKNVAGGCVETRGKLPMLAGVRGKDDGQWLAACPVTSGEQKGLYVTGWSWSAYAYRLEFALRSSVKSKLANDSTDKEPLLYVYMIVDQDVYGAPVSPEVNAQAIAGQKLLEGLQGEGSKAVQLDITGRSFGLAVKRLPVLGDGVGVAVLRSET